MPTGESLAREVKKRADEARPASFWQTLRFLHRFRLGCGFNISNLMLLVAMFAHVPPTQVPRRIMIGRLINLLTKVKTQQVARSRGQRCGDIELAAYL